jgi:hypothetical protein
MYQPQAEMRLKLIDQAAHHCMATVGLPRHCRERARLHDPVERTECPKHIHVLTNTFSPAMSKSLFLCRTPHGSFGP